MNTDTPPPRPDYNISTRFDASNGVITQQVKNHSQELWRWIINTREAQVRDALVALGWTPPPDKPA